MSDEEFSSDHSEVLSSGESSEGELPIVSELGECSKKEQECFCYEPEDITCIKGTLSSLLMGKFTFTQVSCVISTIERCFNEVIKYESGELKWCRVMLADQFYRIRHEILSMVFASSIGIDAIKTDMSFKEIGVDSDRTPDFIVLKENVYYIFEISVGMSEEKSYAMKGVESAGFESKYQKEIQMMAKMNMPVSYNVCFFNMKNPDESNVFDIIGNLPYLFEIDSFEVQKLKALTKNMSRLTHYSRSYLAPASSILFSKDLSLEDKHDNLSFLYKKEDFNLTHEYKDFCISTPVYQKINAMWFRINSIKNRTPIQSAKFSPILDLSTNRLGFVEDRKGITDNELEKILSNNQKQRFFEQLKLRIGDRIEPASNAEGGLKYTKRVLKKDNLGVNPNFDFIEVSTDHVPTIIGEEIEQTEILFYKNKIKEHTEGLFKPVYYDRNYERKYLDSLLEFDMNCTENLDPETFKLPTEAPHSLASCDITKIDMVRITDELTKMLINENSFESTIPVKVQKMKSSFILPMASVTSADRTSIGYKNINFIDEICKSSIGEYTKAILGKVRCENYSFHSNSPPPNEILNNNYKIRYELSNKITKISKDYMKSNKTCKFDRNGLDAETKLIFQDCIKEISSLNKLIQNEEKTLGIKKNIGMVRINCSPKSLMHISFKNEMKHFKDRNEQSSYEGVGLFKDTNMLDSLKTEFQNIQDTFTLNCGPNDDFLIDNKTYGDSKMLNQLKQHTLDSSHSFIKQVKDSFLGHSAAFVSRFAHSLAFYSQLPFNNNFIRVDNLGYSNCLLIVRGGSKIFKTKSSKLFRLIFPCNKAILSQYVDETVGKSSFTRLIINGDDYILTPWSLMHENILMDSISFYPRVCTFCVLNSDHTKLFQSELRKYYVNILLAFHNRRQTESMLANMRYILLSTMGDYSAFNDILPEFIGFNYDKIQAFIRLSVVKNYTEYYNTLVKIQKEGVIMKQSFVKAKLKNVITGEIIVNTEELALMIYSTFLMTKAPYQRPVERASNLKGILKIHDQFDKDVGLDKIGKSQLDQISVVNKGNFLKYSKELMSSDFKIDPYYCTQLGLFADSYFNREVGSEQILVEWIKIINKNWDSMATTTGLRGDTKENFWGQKGFFVIYDKILNEMSYKDKISNILHCEKTDDEKRKAIRELNLTFSESLSDTPETLLFHAVDKRQWRGGREIYVMDLKTKRMQQPIEKFMAYLCKKTDTELISIPSDKRSQVIHHALYEKDIPDKDIKTWFLTFDCSKWAPKSMFIKFALMIIPMASIPKTFKKHFLNYLNLLYSKRLYFNTPEVEVLLNNKGRESYADKYLISDKDKNGYYMIQPYSWVMGIFNYTSSLMHAFNQKYCSYILRESTMDSFNEECSLFMFAHSDDSGGRLSVSCRPMLQRALFIYEMNLKACNHLLSRKKCVVSRIYFEILSIIYMFSQLLALLPKFLGGVRFLPTDKGPAHDMLQSYSKCIELMVAGADFNTAYLYFKFYSAEIWRFYHNRHPIKADYDRPPQYMGMPDAHPLMILVTGSDSDIIRLIFTKGFNNIIMFIRLSKYFDLFESDEGLIKPFKFQVKVRGIKDKFNESIRMFTEDLESWSIANVNYGNTTFNALSFLRKLIDPGFVGALANETEVRRMSRAYFFRSGESLVTKQGNKKLKDVMSLLLEMGMLNEESDSPLFTNYFGEECMKEFKYEMSITNPLNNHIITYFKDVYSNPLRLNEYLNKMEFTPDKLRSVIRTLKPTHMQIVKFGKGFTNTFDPTQLVSYIYEPELAWALPNPNNLLTAKEDFNTLMKHLKLDVTSIDASTALKIVRAHQSKSVKDIYMYSCIPGNIRLIKNFSGMLTFLATNSFHDYEIQGMTLKLRGNLTQAPITDLDIEEEAYYITTLLDVLLTIGKNMSLINLKLNNITILDFPGGNMEDLIDKLQERSFKDVNYTYYNHYIEYIRLKHILWYGETKGNLFKQGSFYTYLKEQKFKGVWYGKGTIAFYSRGDWIIFEIYNNKLMEAYGNVSGKIDKRMSSFLTDALVKNNISSSFTDELLKIYEMRAHQFLGYDLSGDLCADVHMNMRSGIPYKYQGVPHYFIDDIMSSEVEHVKENLFIAKYPGKIDYKIYTLKVERSEVIPILKSVIDPESMESFLASNAYSDLSEFISQGILSNYGAEYYITLNQLKDNYAGSLLYQLMTYTQSNENKLIPRSFKTAVLPAPEGSLLRMMINYQEKTNQQILRVPNKLNPSIMSIRNEYPESFSVILSEKMNENFDNIYENTEKIQLTSEFLKAANSGDLNKTRSALIKLMCYWGYSGLINVIQTYTFNKSVKNHKIFNLESCRSSQMNIYNDLFKILVAKTFKVIEKIYDPNKDYDFPMKGILDISNISEVESNYYTGIAYNCYHYTNPYLHPSISHIKFNKLLIGLIRDPDFLLELTESLKDTFPLNSLSFDPKDISEILSTYNTLRLAFIETNKLDPPTELNYAKSYEHLAHRVTQPLTIIKELGFTKYNTGRLKYHYFLNDYLRHELCREEVMIHVEDQRYIIKQSISKLSDKDIPTSQEFKFEGVLKEDFLESEYYDDISYELRTDDPDMELVEESIQSRSEMYEPSTVKKRGRSIIVPVSWVILPNVEGYGTISNYVNNISENVAILSNCFIRNFHELRNSSVYIVNYGRHENELPDMVVHVISSKHLKQHFWDKYIGGKRVQDYQFYGDLCKIDLIRIKGVTKASDQGGVFIGEKLELKEEEEAINLVTGDPLKVWTSIGFTEEEAQLYNSEREELKGIISDIESTLDEYVKRGILDESNAANIFKKYKNASLKEISKKRNIILNSFFTELELINMDHIVKTGELTNKMTPVDHIKMMQAPEAFGVAFGHSKPDSKAFKDFRYKAELDSLHDNLSDLISSSTLTISEEMYKIVHAYYNSWRHATEHTKHKREMKRFFLNLYLGILNTASRHEKDEKENDKLWQELSNNIALIIGEEPDKGDVDLYYLLPPSEGLRMKYNVVGFE